MNSGERLVLLGRAMVYYQIQTNLQHIILPHIKSPNFFIAVPFPTIVRLSGESLNFRIHIWIAQVKSCSLRRVIGFEVKNKRFVKRLWLVVQRHCMIKLPTETSNLNLIKIRGKIWQYDMV